MRSSRILFLAVAFSLLIDLQSKARDLILTQGLPDFTGSYMNVTYSTGNSNFLASGYTTAYATNHLGNPGIGTLDTYTLSAIITGAGVLTGGTLTIDGGIGAGPDVTLLTGNLITGTNGVAFGYGDGGNQIFQFLFTVTGGSVRSAFGGLGGAGGIILTAQFGGGDNPFTGSWTSSFNNNNTVNGVVDAFAVPEPSSGLLVLVAGVFCAVTSRCRRKTLKV